MGRKVVGLGVWGVGLRVRDLGRGVEGLCLGVWGVVERVGTWGVRLRVKGLERARATAPTV